MFVSKAVLFLSLLAVAFAARNTKMCLHCDHLTDPSQCTTYQACHLNDHSCSTEVRFEQNQYLYKLECKPNHDCYDIENPILGKRAGPHDPHGPGPHEHGQVVCRHCCTTVGCNANLCGGYTTTTMTTPNTTATTVPLPADACQDFEDDNFKCDDYDQFHLCDAADGLSYELGHKRCQLHCGFCMAGGKLADLCQDIEDDKFKCNDYDQYHLCDADGGLEYELGHKRCRKHCGFCGTGQATAVPTDLSTNQPMTTMAPPPQATTTFAPVGVDVTVSQGQAIQASTKSPTNPPTAAPTGPPTNQPTAVPTGLPTNQTTAVPTGPPTNPPKAVPTGPPTNPPTAAPTGPPTNQPTAVPTGLPTNQTTAVPTGPPTNPPKAVPTGPPTNPPTAVPTNPRPMTTVVPPSQATTTFAPVCRDFEDANFACSEWASHGFCQMSTGQGYEIAKLRCAKFCGFCQ